MDEPKTTEKRVDAATLAELLRLKLAVRRATLDARRAQVALEQAAIEALAKLDADPDAEIDEWTGAIARRPRP